ncbi:putative Ig [Tolypothrix tenuis PCC 7101]|uniref:Putative Ig n=1 Tax=Tolypothrix tenuis PCC 7101 TaxID=231146 RepID=A0A1Z4N4V6_9CYAN|nr:PEP-CTERM sorting domain-containing protein [Aulosira sp. FACHB-113]BAZ00783.1 putative Ig [Tolypothrix tenuis PCC 7101]BAZ75294.1 putative Ig [Aulosira laxa NIES-50]
MRNKIIALSVGFIILLTANRSIAGVITLYNETSGVTPNLYNSPELNNAPALTFGSPNGGTQSFSNGVTNLNTSASNNNGIYGGYSNYNLTTSASPSVITPTTLVNSLFPSLDRNAGYSLTFTVKINSQVNDGTNGAYRAGFSVIAISSDKQGIEIGFRNSDIFSQASSSFNSIGEQVTNVSSLLSSLNTYTLNIVGSNYTLTNNTTTLLSGVLRDYTTASGFGSDVYRTSNFIFLGDDTTSARADIDLQSISLDNNTAGVPYNFSATPGILAVIAGGALHNWLKNKKS